MPVTNIPISGELRNIGSIKDLGKELGTREAAAPGFQDQLKDFIQSVNSEMQTSEKVSEDFAAGRINNIHETMVAAEKAAIAFRLVGSIRNQFLEAYHEVMRMPV